MWVTLLTVILICGLAAIAWLVRRRHVRLLETVKIVALPHVYSPELDNSRKLYVYLPPDFEQTAKDRLGILLINDGQDRVLLGLQATLARQFQKGEIRPIVAVAIPANEDRLHEYGTAVAPNDQAFGDKAGAYSKFVTETVLPLIKQQFGLDSTVENTAILGISLGGLSAFDIAWNHKEVFGKVGVMSGSFWWRAASDENRVAAGRRIIHEVIRRTPPNEPTLKIWLQASTRDEVADRDGNGVIDAIQDTLELMDELGGFGYQRGKDMVYVEVVGGRHNYETWQRILPDFLKWAFPNNAVT